MKIDFCPVGERGVIFYLPLPIKKHYPLLLSKLIEYLNQKLGDNIFEFIPSYNSLLIEYNEEKIKEFELVNIVKQQIQTLNTDVLKDNTKLQQSKNHVIPVCYDKDLGLDLESLSKEVNLSIAKVIEIHCSPQYLVYSIGFTPGFAFLADVDERIRTKRHANPRASIPAGSVGIANNQTGIYTTASPAGWKIIGQTPIELYNPEIGLFSKFSIGDSVEFNSISIEEFNRLKFKS